MRIKVHKKIKMTNKSIDGTLSTKEIDVAKKMRDLLGSNRLRFHGHANKRMAERNIIDYEVRQALSNGRHEPGKDRFSKEWNSWEYSIEGTTKDDRQLRIGISFETTASGERLLVVTVIDPTK